MPSPSQGAVLHLPTSTTSTSQDTFQGAGIDIRRKGPPLPPPGAVQSWQLQGPAQSLGGSDRARGGRNPARTGAGAGPLLRRVPSSPAQASAGSALPRPTTRGREREVLRVGWRGDKPLNCSKPQHSHFLKGGKKRHLGVLRCEIDRLSISDDEMR